MWLVSCMVRARTICRESRLNRKNLFSEASFHLWTTIRNISIRHMSATDVTRCVLISDIFGLIKRMMIPEMIPMKMISLVFYCRSMTLLSEAWRRYFLLRWVVTEIFSLMFLLKHTGFFVNAKDVYVSSLSVRTLIFRAVPARSCSVMSRMCSVKP